MLEPSIKYAVAQILVQTVGPAAKSQTRKKKKSDSEVIVGGVKSVCDWIIKRVPPRQITTNHFVFNYMISQDMFFHHIKKPLKIFI